MSDNDLESDTKRFDIYLHLHLHLNDGVNEEIKDVDEEMRSIKDVSVEEYSYEQLILDAHDLALSQFPECSKESVFVSHERMVRGRRCRTPLTCDVGLKRLFSSNHTTYVFFIKCYDSLPGLWLLGEAKTRCNELSIAENVNRPGLRRLGKAKKKSNKLSLAENVNRCLGKAKKKSNRLSLAKNVNSPGLPGLRRSEKAKKGSYYSSLAENVDISDSNEDLIGQASTLPVKNIPLPSIAEIDEEAMTGSANEMGDRTDNASATHVNALSSMVESGLLASDSEVARERRITRSMVENAPLASVNEVSEERRITRSMVENVTLASIAEADEKEERVMLPSNQLNQMGDLTNHVSVPQDYLADGEPKTKVYVRKRRKFS